MVKYFVIQISGQGYGSIYRDRTSTELAGLSTVLLHIGLVGRALTARLPHDTVRVTALVFTHLLALACVQTIILLYNIIYYIIYCIFILKQSAVTALESMMRLYYPDILSVCVF